MRRRLPRFCWHACVLLALLFAPSFAPSLAKVARAEAVDMAVQSDEPAAYRERIDEALREFSVQNYQEARSLFLQAHALLPGARTFRALGLCEYELRNYGETITYMQAALASQVKPLNETLRADTERMMARARNFVGRVVVELRPATAQLLVDGVKLDVSPNEPLWLAMGEHTLEASAPGVGSEKRKLNVKGGEDKTVSFMLTRDDDSNAASDKSEQQASQRRWYKSPWLWGSLGVVVAGAAATTAVLLTRDDGANRDGGSTGKVVSVP